MIRKERKLIDKFSVSDLEQCTFIFTCFDYERKEFHTFHRNNLTSDIARFLMAFEAQQDIYEFDTTNMDICSVVNMQLKPTLKLEDVINYANINNKDRSLIYQEYITKYIKEYTSQGYKYVKWNSDVKITDHINNHISGEIDKRTNHFNSYLNNVYEKAMYRMEKGVLEFEKLKNEYVKLRDKRREIEDGLDELEEKYRKYVGWRYQLEELEGIIKTKENNIKYLKSLQTQINKAEGKMKQMKTYSKSSFDAYDGCMLFGDLDI